MSVDTRYRGVVSEAQITASELEALELQARRFGRVIIGGNLTVSSFFFRQIPPLAQTNLSYSINTLLYQYLIDPPETPTDQYGEIIVGFNKETITAHSLGLNIRWDVLDQIQSLDLTATLPPQDVRFSSSLIAITGPLTSSFRIGASEVDERLRFDPLTISETLTISGDIRLSERLVVDLEAGYVSSSVTTLQLWFFNATFNMERGFAIQYDVDFFNKGLSDPWANVGEGITGTDQPRLFFESFLQHRDVMEQSHRCRFGGEC